MSFILTCLNALTHSSSRLGAKVCRWLTFHRGRSAPSRRPHTWCGGLCESSAGRRDETQGKTTD